jgi:hypothetical protein
MGKIDLHIHTSYSADGEVEPGEIVNTAKQKGLEAIAITDHDTVDGLEEGIEVAKEQNLEMIPGIELDTQYQEENLHILGYYFNWQSEKLREVTEDIRANQYQQARERVGLLQDMGFKLDWEEVEKEARIIPVGGILAKVLMNNGLNDNDGRLEPYLRGERSNQPYFNFYLDYFLQGKPAYVSSEMPDSVEMIKLIQELGGVAILAHPGSAIDLAENEWILNDLDEQGLDGIEAYSTYHSSNENKEFADWASDHQLLITVGSDFHGRLKPDVELGGIENNNYYILNDLKSAANK